MSRYAEVLRFSESSALDAGPDELHAYAKLAVVWEALRARLYRRGEGPNDDFRRLSALLANRARLAGIPVLAAHVWRAHDPDDEWTIRGLTGWKGHLLGDPAALFQETWRDSAEFDVI